MRNPKGKGASAVGAVGHAKSTRTLRPDTSNREPRTLEEAMRRPNGLAYKRAAEVEFGKLIQNETWELVPLEEAEGKKVLDVKLVFDRKFDVDGKETEVKCRIVVRGDQQEKWVNFEETFSPVFKVVSRNILLSLAACNGWHVRQGDFKSAY